jgi:multisubunit Na+/H+ antiporter MnhF subunit
MPDEPVLTLRALNRTLLQRQFLLQRTDRSALEVIEHLVAMQGQDPNWPYVGLWTRKTSFGHDDLTALLHDRSVVRSTMVRATQHLASAADFAWLRPAGEPRRERQTAHMTMTEVYLGFAAFLLLNLLAGLIRIYLGPTPADRMMAAQLLGTTTAAVLLLLAASQEIPALLDVALLFTLLAALFSIAFVRLPPTKNNP